jgi:hypothetical protein
MNSKSHLARLKRVLAQLKRSTPALYQARAELWPKETAEELALVERATKAVDGAIAKIEAALEGAAQSAPLLAQPAPAPRPAEPAEEDSLDDPDDLGDDEVLAPPPAQRRTRPRG